MVSLRQGNPVRRGKPAPGRASPLCWMLNRYWIECWIDTDRINRPRGELRIGRQTKRFRARRGRERAAAGKARSWGERTRQKSLFLVSFAVLFCTFVRPPGELSNGRLAARFGRGVPEKPSSFPGHALNFLNLRPDRGVSGVVDARKGESSTMRSLRSAFCSIPAL